MLLFLFIGLFIGIELWKSETKNTRQYKKVTFCIDPGGIEPGTSEMATLKTGLQATRPRMLCYGYQSNGFNFTAVPRTPGLEPTFSRLVLPGIEPEPPQLALPKPLSPRGRYSNNYVRLN